MIGKRTYQPVFGTPQTSRSSTMSGSDIFGLPLNEVRIDRAQVMGCEDIEILSARIDRDFGSLLYYVDVRNRSDLTKRVYLIYRGPGKAYVSSPFDIPPKDIADIAVPVASGRLEEVALHSCI